MGLSWLAAVMREGGAAEGVGLEEGMDGMDGVEEMKEVCDM